MHPIVAVATASLLAMAQATTFRIAPEVHVQSVAASVGCC
jgi:hypothetical protein